MCSQCRRAGRRSSRPGCRLARSFRHLPAPQPTRIAQAPGVVHPRCASTRRAPAAGRRHAEAVQRQRAASSPRCERRCIATSAGTPSSRIRGLGRLLRLSLPLSRPASCRRRSAYLSLSSETVRRQGRSSCTPSPDRPIAALVCDKTPASRTSRHRKPLWAPVGLGVFMELAEERVSHAISPRDPVRDDETRRESRARASYSKRGSAPHSSASRSMHPNGPRHRERAPGRDNRSDRRSAGLRQHTPGVGHTKGGPRNASPPDA
jgi:hypothetical protein